MKAVPRNPNTFWRLVAGVSLATFALVLTAHVQGHALLGMSDMAIAPVAIQSTTTNDFVVPAVFQAAGPDSASIQGTIAAFRVHSVIPLTATRRRSLIPVVGKSTGTEVFRRVT